MSGDAKVPACVRLSVNLAPDVAEALQRVAVGHGVSVTEAVRVAVSLLWFADDVSLRGDRLVVVGPEGEVGEIREIAMTWEAGR